MAFNSYFNPYYPQPMQDNLAQLRQQQMQTMPPQQIPQIPQIPLMQNPVAQGGVQWVAGRPEAENWLIAPNSAIALWDSTAPVVYLKQADASGKPTLKTYDLVERLASVSDTQKTPTLEYVTRKEFDALAALVSEIKGKKKRKVEEEEDDE
nr:MAG TPA: hypothetical protein [Caudoviricetes sp.]